MHAPHAGTTPYTVCIYNFKSPNGVIGAQPIIYMHLRCPGMPNQDTYRHTDAQMCPGVQFLRVLCMHRMPRCAQTCNSLMFCRCPGCLGVQRVERCPTHDLHAFTVPRDAQPRQLSSRGCPNVSICVTPLCFVDARDAQICPDMQFFHVL